MGNLQKYTPLPSEEHIPKYNLKNYCKILLPEILKISTIHLRGLKITESAIHKMAAHTGRPRIENYPWKKHNLIIIKETVTLTGKKLSQLLS